MDPRRGLHKKGNFELLAKILVHPVRTMRITKKEKDLREKKSSLKNVILIIIMN